MNLSPIGGSYFDKCCLTATIITVITFWLSETALPGTTVGEGDVSSWTELLPHAAMHRPVIKRSARYTKDFFMCAAPPSSINTSFLYYKWKR